MKEGTPKRGRKPLPDICRACGVMIPRPTCPGGRKRERLCAACACEKVMLWKWGKQGKGEIAMRLLKAEKAVKILTLALERKK